VSAEHDRAAVLRYLDELLEVAAFTDYGPIGLQVVGADRVRKVCVAVSASLDVFERAGAAGAQLLVVHHGLFWDGASRVDRDARAPAARDAVPP
jgi:putative NIF3 family GTP cyclohydrolase 1 type 2